MKSRHKRQPDRLLLIGVFVLLNGRMAFGGEVNFPIYVNLAFGTTVTLAPTAHPNVVGASFLFDLNRKLYEPIDSVKEAGVHSVEIVDILMRDSLRLLCSHSTYRADILEFAYKAMSVADTAKRRIYEDVTSVQTRLCSGGVTVNNTATSSGYADLVTGVSARSFSGDDRKAYLLFSIFIRLEDTANPAYGVEQMGLSDIEIFFEIKARADVRLRTAD